MKAHRLTAFLLSICCLLNGCAGGPGVSADTVYSADPFGWDKSSAEVDLSYEVPVSTPNILINRLGYEGDGEKTAIFKGENLPATFAVKDAETDETVYTGTVKPGGYDEHFGESISYGSFTDLKEEGRYYIQMDVIGESYPFLIHDNLYYSFFQRACSRFYRLRGENSGSSQTGGWQLKEKGENRQIRACIVIYQLLTSYELFSGVYTDDTGIAESGNGIPDILDECRYELTWLMEQAQVNPDENGTICGYRAAVFARASYLFRDVDNAFAGECLKVAENSWKSAGKDLTVPEDLIFLSAVELYRLIGSNQYRAIAEEYLQKAVEGSKAFTDLEFFGSITYLNTKNKVNVSLCDRVIKKAMAEVELLVERSKNEKYLVYSEGTAADNAAILEQMIRVCIINHIITNHEYNTVIEDHFHYLMGRNPQGICYAAEWNGKPLSETDVFSDPVQNSAYVFIMSELLSNR